MTPVRGNLGTSTLQVVKQGVGAIRGQWPDVNNPCWVVDAITWKGTVQIRILKSVCSLETRLFNIGKLQT